MGVDAPNVCLEVVKRADDGSGALVVRLYEAWGSRGRATVRLPSPVVHAVRADLLERELAPVETDGATVSLDLRPFEIVTLRLTGP
ncbi:MAG: hypothetical protein JO368_03470 [Acidimicrobiales bacterium]|nr:hypothetical protein [Acidimicrobiales bacterium]